MSSAAPVLRLHFESSESLEREFGENLAHGRAHVPGPQTAELGSTVRLWLTTPYAEWELAAEVVFKADEGPGLGVGLAFEGFDRAAQAELALFVADAFRERPRGPDDHRSQPPAPPSETVSRAHGAAVPYRPSSRPPSEMPSERRSSGPPGSQRPPATTRIRALRELTIPEQIKLAVKAEQADRIALERMLGKTVWEPLLRNPRITLGEVARIARKGTVPRPLLELIVDNAVWVKTGIVRRALLSNPKLSMDMVMRVLKLTPRAELKTMVRNPAYPMMVRSTAKRMVADA